MGNSKMTTTSPKQTFNKSKMTAYEVDKTVTEESYGEKMATMNINFWQFSLKQQSSIISLPIMQTDPFEVGGFFALG